MSRHITLITGGARSGKTRYALEPAEAISPRTYIATAQLLDDEMRERAARQEREMAARRLGEEPSEDAFARFETVRQATLKGESRRADVDGIDDGATRVRSP